MPTPAPPIPVSTASPAPGSSGRRIAIVGGQGAAARDGVSGFVTQLGLEPAFLGDAPADAGSTFIERLDALRDVDYAIVLLSADEPAQEGVLLEIGFLLGSVGRRRICCVVAGTPASAPQWDGMVRHAMDGTGLWRLLLAREMRQAGLDVDMNRAV